MASSRYGVGNTEKNTRSVALILSCCNWAFFPTALNGTLPVRRIIQNHDVMIGALVLAMNKLKKIVKFGKF